jgi:hypothetical protein
VNARQQAISDSDGKNRIVCEPAAFDKEREFFCLSSEEFMD